ncbi:MAG: cold shock domain-containing protein [Burkholderiaceae bacterium]
MNTVTPRFTGVLTKWNAERGFGFLTAEQGGQALFVHVSAFPRDGRPPVVGEVLSFEIDLDKEGRKRAVRLRRPGAATEVKPERSRPPERDRRHTGRSTGHAERTGLKSIGQFALVMMLVGSVGWYGYMRYAQQTAAMQAVPQSLSSPATPVTEASPAAPAFQCDGRKHCSQMTS